MLYVTHLFDWPPMLKLLYKASLLWNSWGLWCVCASSIQIDAEVTIIEVSKPYWSVVEAVLRRPKRMSFHKITMWMAHARAIPILDVKICVKWDSMRSLCMAFLDDSIGLRLKSRPSRILPWKITLLLGRSIFGSEPAWRNTFNL